MSETQPGYEQASVAEQDRRRAARTAAWLLDPQRLVSDLDAACDLLDRLILDGRDTGARLSAIEPLAAMRRIASAALARKLAEARANVARLTQAERDVDPQGWLLPDCGSDWLTEAGASRRLDGETHVIEREGQS